MKKCGPGSPRWPSYGGSWMMMDQMVPFAGYELPVLYETEWGGIIKGKRGKPRACSLLLALLGKEEEGERVVVGSFMGLHGLSSWLVACAPLQSTSTAVLTPQSSTSPTWGRSSKEPFPTTTLRRRRRRQAGDAGHGIKAIALHGYQVLWRGAVTGGLARTVSNSWRHWSSAILLGWPR